jgi:flagellar hook protein FlgE
MLRSLSSSISGLKNHQVRMDLIGNNIANVNTTGYKAQRVTFEESFSQLLQGATKPGESGGTNPLQVGLGMGVGSVDTILSQGNLETTGLVTDIAIEGSAYFAVSDGTGTYYTRNGAFQLDSNGQMVLPTNGFVLQGKIADAQGNFPAGTVISDIRIPFSEQAPAKATTSVDFSRNLDSNAGAKGSVIYTQSFIHHAEPADSLTSMRNSKGRELGLRVGETLTISASTGGTTFSTNFLVAENSTINDVVAAIEAFLQSNIDGNARAELISPTMNGTLAGGITVYGNNNFDIRNLQITSNGPLSNSFVAKAFNFPSTIPTGSTQLNYNSDALRAPAVATDLLAELFDANGDRMGLEDGDEISVTGSVGGESIVPNSPLVFLTASTTMQDLLDKIKDDFKLPERDGTIQNNLSVSLNNADSNDQIPDGAIVIRGAKGEAFSLQNLSISASNSNNLNPAPTLFNANLSMTNLQKAKDTGVFDSSIQVYDQSGAPHVLTMTYVHTGVPGQWNWEVSVSGDEALLSGFKGKIGFGQDGSVASFTFDDDSTLLTLDPNNGSELLKIQLNVGGPGNFQGITQFSAPSTVSAVNQNGYPTGALTDISIDELGVITGTFSNGTAKPLAQVMVVDFTNPGGLQKVSDSVYITSANSGDPIWGAPGTQSSSRVKPGALEMSNVDLAKEFTSMIITQKGYQANARVITVSDSMLEELVSLKR